MGIGTSYRAGSVATARGLPDPFLHRRGQISSVATPLTISIPHQLGRAEARRRIEAGFTKIIHQLPGSGGACSERWDGDRLTFGVAVMGQTIAGVVDVHDAAVTIEIELPGVLGMIAGGLKDRLRKVGTLLLTKK
jgi:putative polyhydroxyalkanoic acid system protein